MKIQNVKLDENNTFVSGEIIDDCTTSFNQSIKREYRNAVKQAKKNGEPEPDKPVGMDVPATLVVDLTGAKLEDVLAYVHSPRRISQQGVWKKSYRDEQAFDDGLREQTFTIPAVPERTRETLTPMERIKRDYQQGKISKEELFEWLENN